MLQQCATRQVQQVLLHSSAVAEDAQSLRRLSRQTFKLKKNMTRLHQRFKWRKYRSVPHHAAMLSLPQHPFIMVFSSLEHAQRRLVVPWEWRGHH